MQSDSAQWKVLCTEVSPLLGTEIIDKGQDRTVFSGMLSNPVPGLKSPFYPQEEAVKGSFSSEMPQEEERRTGLPLTHTVSLCPCRSLPRAHCHTPGLGYCTASTNAFLVLNQRSSVPRHALHPQFTDPKMCCPTSLQGRTSLSAISPSCPLLQGLPQLQRPSSPRSSSAAHTGPDSDGQHSPRHSWPG